MSANKSKISSKSTNKGTFPHLINNPSKYSKPKPRTAKILKVTAPSAIIVDQDMDNTFPTTPFMSPADGIINTKPGVKVKAFVENPGMSLHGKSIAKPSQKVTKPRTARIGGKSKTASILGDLASDPLKWFRNEQETQEISRSFSRNPVQLQAQLIPRGFSDINEPEKLITIGGYIINIEKGLPPYLNVVIKPKLSSNDSGLDIEIKIGNVDPSLIRFEKRYNAILVIGIKESGLKSEVQKQGPNPNQEITFEEDLIEVVNIFIPRDVPLSRIMVTQPDSKGRIFIKAP